MSAPSIARRARDLSGSVPVVTGLVSSVLRRRAPVRYLGWVGHRNLGDEAVREAVVDLLSVEPAAGGLDGSLEVVAADWPSWGLARALDRPTAYAGTIVGGGTVIGGRYLPFVEETIATDHPVAVLGSGVIDPAFPWSYRGRGPTLRDWCEVLPRCAYVGVRGPRSQQLLAEVGVASEVFGDPGCRFVQPDGHWTPEPGLIGVNVGQAASRTWGSELAMLATLSSFVRRLAASGHRVEYYVVSPGDLVTTRQVQRESGTEGAPVFIEFTDATRYLERVRRCEAFVALKLHAGVLAACAGVPMALVGYQPKGIDFMESIGAAELCARSDRLTVGWLEARLAHLRASGPEVRATALAALRAFDAVQRARGPVLRARFTEARRR